MEEGHRQQQQRQQQQQHFETHSLIFIHGLTSEAGKELNNGLGIIINDQNKKQKISSSGDEEDSRRSSEPQAAPGMVRYPVRVFATVVKKKNEVNTTTLTKDQQVDGGGGDGGEEEGRWDVLETPLDRQLKVSNVVDIREGGDSGSSATFLNKESALQCLQEAIGKYAIKYRENDEQRLFWYEASYKNQPELYKRSIHYAYGLKFMGRPDEAIAVCHHVNRLVDLLSTEAWISVKKCVQVYTDTVKPGQEFDDDLATRIKVATHMALTIPTDTPENKKLSDSALGSVQRAICYIVGNDCYGYDDLKELNFKVTLKRYANNPNDLVTTYNLGGAYHMCGRHWECVRLFRKLLLEPPERLQEIQSRGADISRIKKDLMVSQLQCPGMPLENFVVAEYDSQRAKIFPKDLSSSFGDVSNAVLAPHEVEEGSSAIGVRVEPYRLPHDLNDPEIFGDLLKRLDEAVPFEINPEGEWGV